MANPGELVVTIPKNRRVDVQVRGHTLHTDQPLDNGGEDVAASPFELFLASIGACAGIFIQGFCANRGIPTEGIRVIERPEYDAQGTLRAVALDVQLPSTFPDKYKEPVLRVVEQCSVKRAIAAQPEFRVRAV